MPTVSRFLRAWPTHVNVRGSREHGLLPNVSRFGRAWPTHVTCVALALLLPFVGTRWLFFRVLLAGIGSFSQVLKGPVPSTPFHFYIFPKPMLTHAGYCPHVVLAEVPPTSAVGHTLCSTQAPSSMRNIGELSTATGRGQAPSSMRNTG